MRIPHARPTRVGRRFIDLDSDLTAAIVWTIEAGWTRAVRRAEVNRQTDEVTITECLRDGMRAALLDCCFPWAKTMIVAPGTESRSAPELTVPDGRTDIPMFLTNVFEKLKEHDPHAIVECKRVAEGDTTLAREYVVEGVDRFKTEKYGENHSNGFMVGYVISGSRRGVVNGINSYLHGRSRILELLDQGRVEAVPNCWLSEHPRRHGRSSILLHHSMLLVS